MLKAVIFDVDGTLIDSVDAHARSWHAALAEAGHDIPYADVRHQIGKGGENLLHEFLTDAQFSAEGEKIETAAKERFLRDEQSGVVGFPKTRELFERILADHHRIVLASSAAGEQLATFKERARITDLIEDETSKDDAEKSKPDPDIFLAALDKLDGLQPAECFVIGDAPWDAIAAERAGLRTIGVLSGGFAETELREAGCVAIYRDVADLLEQYNDSPLAEAKL